MKYGKFALRVLFLAVATAIIASLLNYALALVEGFGLGIFGGLINAVIISGVFIFSTRVRPGRENFIDTIPVILVSLALVELLQNYVSYIPSIVSTFTWSNVAVLLSSVFLGDAIVRKYIVR